MQAIDEAKEFIARSRVEACHRFVEHEGGRAHGEHACKGDTALLTARELEGRTVLEGLIVKLDQFDRVLHALFDLCCSEAQIARTKRHVFIDGCCEELVFGILEDNADVATGFVGGLLVGKVLPVPEHLAACGVDHAVQVQHERGFS